MDPRKIECHIRISFLINFPFAEIKTKCGIRKLTHYKNYTLRHAACQDAIPARTGKFGGLPPRKNMRAVQLAQRAWNEKFWGYGVITFGICPSSTLPGVGSPTWSTRAVMV
jgi:hypothetical protein